MARSGAKREASRAYASAVPAVERAIRALEALQGSRQGLSLAQLSRATAVSPSSLLAIVTTLVGRGYVLRSEPGPTYRLGPALAGLGAAAAEAVDLLREFQAAATPVARETGESVLLWAMQGDDAALVAAVEGGHGVRYVPRPGLRLPAVACAPGRAMLEARSRAADEGWALGDLEPGVAHLALPLVGRNPRMVLGAISLAGPAQRLSGQARNKAMAALRLAASALGGLSESLGASTSAAGRRGFPSHTGEGDVAGGVGRLSSRELGAFLSGAWVANLACLQENGYPYTVPVWYEWEGGCFWVVPRARSQWARFLQINPRVSLTVSESEPPLRRVLVEGRAEVVEAPGQGRRAEKAEARMARRYLGTAAPTYLRSASAGRHWLVRIVPEKLVTWRGLAPHPRYQEPRGRGGRGEAAMG